MGIEEFNTVKVRRVSSSGKKGTGKLYSKKLIKDMKTLRVEDKYKKKGIGTVGISENYL